MDKNFTNKMKEFFKKEGFYVVLFLCLCVVTMVAAVSIKKYKSAQTPPPAVEQKGKDITLNLDENKQNAELAENKKDQSKKSNKDKVLQTSTPKEVSFSLPVSGDVIRDYTYPAMKMVEYDKSFRDLRGINIAAKTGTEVKAAADGKVEKIEKDVAGCGTMITIAHANGLRTIYGNLDSEVKVKVGDVVTSNTIIGRIGGNAPYLTYKDSKEFLNIQVAKVEGDKLIDLDPGKYFKFQ